MFFLKVTTNLNIAENAELPLEKWVGHLKRNLAQQAEDAEQLLRLRFSFCWQFWGGDVADAVTWPYISFLM